MPLPFDFPDDVPSEVADWLAEDWNDSDEWVGAHFIGDPSGWEIQIEYADGSTATLDISDFEAWSDWIWDLYDWFEDYDLDPDVDYTGE